MKLLNEVEERMETEECVSNFEARIAETIKVDKKHIKLIRSEIRVSSQIRV